MIEIRTRILFALLMLWGLCQPLEAQTVTYQVSGKVFLDTIGNCTYDIGEPSVPGILLVMESFPSGGKIFSVSEPSLGYIPMLIIKPPGDTLLRVYAQDLDDLGFGCPVVYEFPLSGKDETLVVDFALQSGACSRMGVSLSGISPSPCAVQQLAVRACNYGLGTAKNAYVDVRLDPAILFQSSTLPGMPQADNTWRFALGDVAASVCRDFSIDYQLDCAVEPGQIICSEALVFPDTVCLGGSGWSGANVLGQATCAGDSVRFTLENRAEIPTSPGLNYIIAEDLIMYRQDTYQLGPTETITFAMPANGATWHLSATQEPGYPGGLFANISIEGCGTNPSGESTTGVFAQYPFQSGQFNRATECREAMTTSLPNEIQALPKGYGSAHLIRAGDEIEYQIYFQNTGTDTAYTLELRATLDPAINPVTVAPGASSHPYTFAQNQFGKLNFTFSNIQLPDSATNAPASRGFVSYRARTLPNIQDGTIVSAKTGIYLNDTLQTTTNTVFHTIGENFIVLVPVHSALSPPLAFQVAPNPASRLIQVACAECAGTDWQVDLLDLSGHLLKTGRNASDQLELDCQGLPAGLYLLQARIGQRRAIVGKVMIQ